MDWPAEEAIMWTFVVFDARVVRAGQRAEAEAEDVALVWAVPHQERPVWLLRQLRLRVLETKGAPIPAALQRVT